MGWLLKWPLGNGSGGEVVTSGHEGGACQKMMSINNDDCKRYDEKWFWRYNTLIG